jgi:DNA polymerase III subunit epsilon
VGRSIPLSQATFVIVDIETTGSIPAQHALMEIGAVKIMGGRVVERFQSLINPEQKIPPFIQKLTGILPEMVSQAPLLSDVLPQFWNFLGDSVFVAHNVSFDFQFLSATRRKLTGIGLENPQICTCRLSRKLLPDLRKKNLGAVSQHLDITIQDRHRAMGDAEATAQVFLKFLEMMKTEGVTTLGKLLEYQKKGGKRYGNLKVPFPEERLSEFSQQPGVYFMRNQNGEILYIGKAKNLRKRLQSYFTGLNRQPTKVQELMQQVFDIETKILGSDLEALLEESYLIKHHQPYYNRQIKNFNSFPFLKITVQDRYPRISITSDIENDQALYFGPYRRKQHLNHMVESLSKVFQLRNCADNIFHRHQSLETPCMAFEIGTCSAPCVRKISPEAYRGDVNEIIGFLEGRVTQLTQRMTEKRDQYSETLAFEKAGQIQARLLELMKLQAHTQYLAQAVHQNHFLIALPDREPSRHLLLYVYKGRPYYKQLFNPDTESVKTVLEKVTLLQEMLASHSEEHNDAIQKQELEEIRIIAHWLKNNDRDPKTQVWDLMQPYAALEMNLRNYFSRANANVIKPAGF